MFLAIMLGCLQLSTLFVRQNVKQQEDVKDFCITPEQKTFKAKSPVPTGFEQQNFKLHSADRTRINGAL